MRRLRVTGFVWIEDDEFDAGPMGPLTEAAFVAWVGSDIEVIEDLTFELVDDDEGGER